MAENQSAAVHPKVTLYWLNQSRAQRIVWLLEELGLEYDIKSFQRTPAMLAPEEAKEIHPLGKFPMVEVDGKIIAESGLITEYLIDKFGPQLKPKDEDDQLLYKYYLHYAEGSLMPPMLVGFVIENINKASVPFFVKPLIRMITGGVESRFLLPNYKTHFTFLESELSKREYLAGSEFSGADILISFQLAAAKRVGALNKESYPKVWEYMKKCEAREAWKRATKKFQYSTTISSKAQTILITGANKGIGYGIVRTLHSTAPQSSTIYLTSRNEEAGRKALTELTSDSLRPELVYHKLDVSDQKSIDMVYERIKDKHGTLDVLVNNASVAYGSSGPGLAPERANEMVGINYYGTLNMCKKFLPIMTPKTGRIVTVSSVACHLSGFHSEELRKEISSPELTVEKLTELIEQFKKDVRDGRATERRWPKGYSVTKAGQTALNGILARENPGILINCCCPGWVDTDMGMQVGNKPPKSIDEGARIPCRLAVGDINGITGEFWENPSLRDKGFGNVSVW